MIKNNIGFQFNLSFQKTSKLYFFITYYFYNFILLCQQAYRRSGLRVTWIKTHYEEKGKFKDCSLYLNASSMVNLCLIYGQFMVNLTYVHKY